MAYMTWVNYNCFIMSVLKRIAIFVFVVYFSSASCYASCIRDYDQRVLSTTPVISLIPNARGPIVDDDNFTKPRNVRKAIVFQSLPVVKKPKINTGIFHKKRSASVVKVSSIVSEPAQKKRSIFHKNRKSPEKDNLLMSKYTVQRVTYYPVKYDEYKEIGIASWYGDANHKRLTANGEVFDKHRITAAHKLLPLPSMVKVTNLENDREIIVKVNDRGPFVGDRLIDLSEKGAKLLGFRDKGLARVKVELLSYGSEFK